MYRIFTTIILLLLSLSFVQAQATCETSEDACTQQNSSDNQSPASTDICDPNVLNYCHAGQPWGDGRCISEDPNVTSYYYEVGWYYAALECGVIGNLPSDLEPYGELTAGVSVAGFSASCGANLYSFYQEFSASWNAPVDKQAKAVFDYGTKTPVETSKGTQVGISSDDTKASVNTNSMFPQYTQFKNVRFHLEDTNGNRLTPSIKC